MIKQEGPSCASSDAHEVSHSSKIYCLYERATEHCTIEAMMYCQVQHKHLQTEETLQGSGVTI